MTSRASQSIFGAIFAMGATHMAFASPLNVSPPLEPGGEEMVSDGSAFAESCLKRAESLAVQRGWKLEKPMVSKNKDWGLVWRVDFKLQKGTVPGTNRIMCWDGDKEILITMGEDVLPLFAE